METNVKGTLLDKKYEVKPFLKKEKAMRILRRNKGGRLNTRVDFTPMVDMNMLLLTFFMFCTTLSKHQVMDIVMPAALDEDQTIVCGDPIPESQTITLILADKNKMYYYEGMPNYEEYTSLKEINYKQLRNVIARKNDYIVAQVNELTKKKNANQLSAEDYKAAVREAKRYKKGTIAVIKATETAEYQNLINVLDEMAICSVGRYAIVDITETDDFLIKNYESKGLYAQENSK